MLEVNKENIETYKKKILKYKNIKGPLIPMLHDAQAMFGYIPLEAQNIIEAEYDISNAYINGVISFYEMFYQTPTGKYHIGVCNGTSCHINRSNKVLLELENELQIKKHETTKDGLFTIIPVKCIGNCSEGPNLTVNNKVYSQVAPSDVKSIIAEYKEKKLTF